jgi:hypothetical protein
MMSADQRIDPDFDPRQGDPVYHQRSPADSGTASSFANRYNEGPPGEGHDAAAHDRKTGAPVHGDGTSIEEPPAHWQRGDSSGTDPAATDVGADEAARVHRPAGEGQIREAHPGEPER